MCESEASMAREIVALHWGCTNSGTEESFCSGEGRVHEWSPRNGFSRTFQSVCERSKNLSCRTEKLPVKINHSENSLETGFVCWLWKGGDSRGVLHQGRATRGSEAMSISSTANWHLGRPIVRPYSQQRKTTCQRCWT